MVLRQAVSSGDTLQSGRDGRGRGQRVLGAPRRLLTQVGNQEAFLEETPYGHRAGLREQSSSRAAWRGPGGLPGCSHLYPLDAHSAGHTERLLHASTLGTAGRAVLQNAGQRLMQAGNHQLPRQPQIVAHFRIWYPGNQALRESLLFIVIIISI